MYNKRLLLLGISIFILSSGWMYPTKTIMSPGKNATASSGSGLLSSQAGLSYARVDFRRPVIDTQRLAGTNAAAIQIKADPQTYLFSELFLATSVGGSNGALLNPKALNFIQDYVKENWEELELVRTTGGSYFNLIESILLQYDLPKELITN